MALTLSIYRLPGESQAFCSVPSCPVRANWALRISSEPKIAELYCSIHGQELLHAVQAVAGEPGEGQEALAPGQQEALAGMIEQPSLDPAG